MVGVWSRPSLSHQGHNVPFDFTKVVLRGEPVGGGLDPRARLYACASASGCELLKDTALGFFVPVEPLMYDEAECGLPGSSSFWIR